MNLNVCDPKKKKGGKKKGERKRRECLSEDVMASPSSQSLKNKKPSGTAKKGEKKETKTNLWDLEKRFLRHETAASEERGKNPNLRKEGGGKKKGGEGGRTASESPFSKRGQNAFHFL